MLVLRQIKRTLTVTKNMADLNLKNIRAAYKGREEGINDSGVCLTCMLYILSVLF